MDVLRYKKLDFVHRKGIQEKVMEHEKHLMCTGCAQDVYRNEVNYGEKKKCITDPV